MTPEKKTINISFSLNHLKTRGTTISPTVEQPEEPEGQKYMIINNFFKPDEFVSGKLKVHYETILSKLDKLKIPTGVTEHSSERAKFKSDK